MRVPFFINNLLEIKKNLSVVTRPLIAIMTQLGVLILYRLYYYFTACVMFFDSILQVQNNNNNTLEIQHTPTIYIESLKNTTVRI